MEAVPSESVQLVSVPQRASLARESVRLSTHLTWLFDVRTRLSHRGNKLRLVFVDLHISEYVVYETGESRGSLGTDDADASDLSNRASKVPALLSMFFTCHTVFSSGISSTVCMPRNSMVNSSSKRFSSIGLLYTVVFFMITSFGTAKIQNYIKLSSETSDYQFVNF